MSALPALRSAILSTPWAIVPGMLEMIAEVVGRRAFGGRLSPDEIAALRGQDHDLPNGAIHAWSPGVDAAGQGRAGAPGTSQGGTVAVLSIFGIIAQHASQVDDISARAGTSTDRVAQSFRSAVSDPNVKAIVLNIDSPGGSVFGVQALSDEIFRARGRKPIVAQANSLAASAAYWIATQADEIVVTPGGQVGSIGAYALHEDISQAAEGAGLRYTYISAGKYKIEGNPHQPLGAEAASAAQKAVDSYYSDFVNTVARGRGVKASDVRDGFGQGRMEKDRDAIRLRMVDRIGTLDETLRRVFSMSSGRGVGPSASAQMDFRIRRHKHRIMANQH